MQLATKGESDLTGFEINAAIALDVATWSVFQNLTVHTDLLKHSTAAW